MNLKAGVQELLEQVRTYNVFAHEEGEYGDDDGEPRDREKIIQHQRYATRLYVILFIVAFYVLIVATVMNPQTRLITVSNITPTLFDHLRSNYPQDLSCPCSTISVPYEAFVSSIVSLDPVCTSIFTSRQWIEALYLINASAYLMPDFRATANSQFELLAALCSFSNDTIYQNMNDIENNQLVSVELLSEDQVQPQVNLAIEVIRANSQIQVPSIIQFLQITTQSNGFVSALNTASHIVIHVANNQYIIEFGPQYVTDSSDTCVTNSRNFPAGFYSNSYLDAAGMFYAVYGADQDDDLPNASAIVSGFLGGCYPLDALLESTLDCLYDGSCFKALLKYFPALNQTNLNWTTSVLPSSQKNVSVNDRLSNVFIDQWLTQINYSRYVAECAPSICTYTITDRTNFSYTIGLLLSLYGGLTILLRLIAWSVVNVASKIKIRLTNINNEPINFVARILLFLTLLLFNSLNSQVVTISVSDPSFTTYNHLQTLYPTTLTCSCSNMVIPYSTFANLTPTFHQVCSSGFITDDVISLFSSISYAMLYTDWRYQAFSQFGLLSKLCKIANSTIGDAVDRFNMRSFVTSNLLTEIDFSTQLDTIFTQFNQSTATDYRSLVDLVLLVTQVDQPFVGQRLGQDTIQNAQPIFGSLAGFLFNNNLTYINSTFLSASPYDIVTNVQCICAANPNCLQQLAFYEYHWFYDDVYLVSAYTAPGLVLSCSAVVSLLSSTLECFYSDSDCLSMLLYYTGFDPNL
ncbi:unnamed protein product [Adineta steineri]|uniref:Transmembrane protein n=1 Tax=Adineta steineri TaxID=433720 RepID=A0A814BJS3_9BILA|nr:unnamed protein product [Adineta steineri]